MGYLLISFRRACTHPCCSTREGVERGRLEAQKHRLLDHDSVISLRGVLCFGYISKVQQCLAFHVLVSF